MKSTPRRILLIALGAGAFTIGAIWLLTIVLPTRPARYGGRTVADWVEQLHSPDADARKRAQEIVTGTVIPGLIDSADHETDSAVRVWLVRNLNQLPGVDINFDSAYGRRARALLSLGEIGPLGRQAESFLFEKLKSRDIGTRMPAARALADLNTEASKLVPILIEWLNDPDDDSQIGAIAILGEYGKDASAALPSLAKLLKSPHKDVPESAQQAIRNITAASQP